MLLVMLMILIIIYNDDVDDAELVMLPKSRLRLGGSCIWSSNASWSCNGRWSGSYRAMSGQLGLRSGSERFGGVQGMGI